MTVRLIPYRPLAQVYADGNVMALMLAVGALAARSLAGDNPGLRLPLVFLAIVSVTLLSVILADWRARRRGAEMIARSEHYRRTLIERAERPLWESMGSLALVVGFTITVLLLAGLNVSEWWIVPPAAIGASLLGAIAGAYVWTYSKHAASALAQATSDSIQQPKTTPLAELAKRHYTGYATGLAVGLFASTAFDDRTIASGALLLGFIAGKCTSDSLFPQVFFGTSPQSPRTLVQFLSGIVFAVVWWGIPFGVLLSIANHILAPDAGIDSLVVSFAASILGAIVFSVFVTVLVLITAGRPSK